METFVRLTRQPQLPQVVHALQLPDAFPRVLNGRQSQRDNYADDGNDHQQIDDGEAAAPGREHALGVAV